MREPWQQALVDLEESLLRPEVRASRECLDALLCEDFREIGASGRVFGKDDVLWRLPDESGVGFEATCFEVHRIVSDVALVVYRAVRTAGGKRAQSLRSSLWRCEAGRWRIAFHQGTPLPDAAGIGETSPTEQRVAAR